MRPSSAVAAGDKRSSVRERARMPSGDEQVRPNDCLQCGMCLIRLPRPDYANGGKPGRRRDAPLIKDAAGIRWDAQGQSLRARSA